MNETEEAECVVKSKDVQNVLLANINNRLAIRQNLWEKIVALDGEIAGLREAQYQVDKLASR